MTKHKTKKADVAARITIVGPGRMTAKGRREIAAWLRRHASHLLKHGKDYTDGRFTGRYFYV